MNTTQMTVEVPIVETYEDLRRLTNAQHLAYRLYWQTQMDEGMSIEKEIGVADGVKWIPAMEVSYYGVYRFKQMPKMVELDCSLDLIGQIYVKNSTGIAYMIDGVDLKRGHVYSAHHGAMSMMYLKEECHRPDGSRFEMESV